MNFNSFQYFLLFLPAVLIATQLARRLSVEKAPQICILIASMVFYAWTKPSHLGYLLGSILANWQIARMIAGAAQPRRNRLLQAGLVLNLGFLSVFKYLGALIGNSSWFDLQNVKAHVLAIPLGISFFTFAQIMYLVDCYEELAPPSNLFDHATFVSFFPYVISGPISRAKRIIHQFPLLNGPSGPSADTVARALHLFSLGLIKKVVLADAFSIAANFGFDNIANLSALEAWCFACAYLLQLYFDFSGYSDMAIASALFCGIEIPRNFDAPLRSTSIREYWERWNISLTSFITSYVYTPVVRSFSRATLGASVVATLVTMTLLGLWHGPSWNFIVFGIIHGTALSVNQYWKRKKMPLLPNWLGWMLTLAVVNVAMVFFRTPDLRAAALFLSRMVIWHHPFSTVNLRQMNGAGLMVGVFILAQTSGVVAAFFGKSTDQLARDFRPTWLNYAATVACALISMLYLNSSVSKPFVYFAF